MKLTKTESAILGRLNKTVTGRLAIGGVREFKAAQKLAGRGLVNFENRSERVVNCRRTRMGDYRSEWVASGVVSRVA